MISGGRADVPRVDLTTQPIRPVTIEPTCIISAVLGMLVLIMGCLLLCLYLRQKVYCKQWCLCVIISRPQAHRSHRKGVVVKEEQPSMQSESSLSLGSWPRLLDPRREALPKTLPKKEVFFINLFKLSIP